MNSKIKTNGKTIAKWDDVALKEAGYAIVPLKPTNIMVEELLKNSMTRNIDKSWGDIVREQWAAMIKTGDVLTSDKGGMENE